MDIGTTTLKDFIKCFVSSFTTVAVVGAFDGKVLAKNYRVGKDEELDNRVVIDIHPTLRLAEEKDGAFCVLTITVDGEKEYQNYLAKQEIVKNKKSDTREELYAETGL